MELFDSAHIWLVISCSFLLNFFPSLLLDFHTLIKIQYIYKVFDIKLITLPTARQFFSRLISPFEKSWLVRGPVNPKQAPPLGYLTAANLLMLPSFCWTVSALIGIKTSIQFESNTYSQLHKDKLPFKLKFNVWNLSFRSCSWAELILHWLWIHKLTVLTELAQSKSHNGSC